MLGQKSRKAKQNALIQNRYLTCPRQVSRFQLQQVHARGRNRSGHCLSGRQSGETWKRLALKSGCKIRTGRSGPTELAILSIYSFKFWGIFFWTILIWVAATAQAFFAAKGSLARTAADKIFPWYLKWWGTPGAKWSQWMHWEQIHNFQLGNRPEIFGSPSLHCQIFHSMILRFSAIVCLHAPTAGEKWPWPTSHCSLHVSDSEGSMEFI